MDVAGVDGCPAGWVVVVAATDPLRAESAKIAPDFKRVLAITRHCAAIAVDIPIGLSETDYWRGPDVAARAVLGKRRSSVFPSPLRQIVGCGDYDDAKRISFEICGKKPTLQAFNISGKIAEVNEAITPETQRRVREVHPEVCFWALHGTPMEHKKSRVAGRTERLSTLSRAFRGDLSATFTSLRASLSTGQRVGWDDFLDACAAAWTAGRIAYGTEQRFPLSPDTDSHGLRMEIVY